MIFLVIISLLQEVLAVAGEGECSVLQVDITPTFNPSHVILQQQRKEHDFDQPSRL